MTAIRFTIYGESASKSNSRRLVPSGACDPLTGEARGHQRLIKSAKALAFERMALEQIPPRCRLRLDMPLRVVLVMYYRTRRPDLDEAVVLDAIQDRYARRKVNGRRLLVQRGVYCNDRQIWEKHVYKRIDHRNPRVEVVVEPMAAALDEIAGDIR